MTERESYLRNAEDLMNDAVEMRDRITRLRHESLPLAQQVVDDSVRVYSIAESTLVHTPTTRTQMAALLTRALVLTDALRGGVQ